MRRVQVLVVDRLYLAVASQVDHIGPARAMVVSGEVHDHSSVDSLILAYSSDPLSSRGRAGHELLDKFLLAHDASEGLAHAVVRCPGGGWR